MDRRTFLTGIAAVGLLAAPAHAASIFAGTAWSTPAAADFIKALINGALD